jgi:predicted homoserine dehydrogenase-like protein
MIIVDTALEQRHKENKPIKIGIVGAGYMGRQATLHILSGVKGMKVVAISNRTIAEAKRAYEQADITDYRIVSNKTELEETVASGGYAVTSDAFLLCAAEGIDAIMECTGVIEFGARIAMSCIENKKHLISLNADLDATVGPILKVYADEAGIVLTGMDGDQPGVIMNLVRFIRTVGYNPILAGNIKGLHDPYRNPDTQREFAQKYHQKTRMITSFADGTKMSMEMAQVANATGFKTAKRGMYGFRAKLVNEALELYPKDKMLNGGLVDYLLGAEPSPGVFVIGYNDHPIKQQFMKYMKMGDGPFYLFYIPYHLPAVEVPLTVARAVLFNDATIAPKGPPVCEVLSVAKKDMKAGEILDGIGGFTVYGMIDDSATVKTENLLPTGLSEGCILKKDLLKDQPISYDDVELPKERLVDKLMLEQDEYFNQVQIQATG